MNDYREYKPATTEKQIQDLIRLKDKIQNEFIKVSPLIELLKSFKGSFSKQLENAPDVTLLLELQEEHSKMSHELIDQYVIKIDNKINELIHKMKIEKAE